MIYMNEKSHDVSFLPLLVRDGSLTTSRIIDAFRAIQRKDFVRVEDRARAEMNIALPLYEGQTVSQPLVVARMLELLAPKSGEKILEIGSGSGWQTALLAECVEGVPPHQGKVITMERILSLKKITEQNVARYHFLEKGIVKIIHGDGREGYLQDAPYNHIIVNAAAPMIFQAWKEEVMVGGRIVAPLEESIVVLQKKSSAEFIERRYFGFRLAPLLSGTVDNSPLLTT